MKFRKCCTFVLLIWCSCSLFAQQTVATAGYEKLFAAAQKYEQNGQWFKALATWYDCVEADLSGSDEAWKRYELIEAMIASGDAAVWKTLESDVEQYWQTHFPYVFTETASGVQKVDTDAGTAEYVVVYEKSYTAQYQNILAMMQASGRTGNWSWGPSLFDCVVQLSLVSEDGTVLFNGTPQIAGGRYVFSGLPRAFIPLIGTKKAYVRCSVVAVRNADGKLVRFPGAEDNWIISRYRSEVQEREQILTVPLKDRM